jgi:hypothetical protein
MTPNSTNLKTRDTSVMAGIDKHIASSTTINGTAYTPADLKAVFRSQITAIDANQALHKQLADGVANAKTLAKTVNDMFHLLRSALIAQYGKNSNAVLNDFGMTVPKTPGAKTVDAKATAQAKRSATRAARNTMGSVQKKAVKGQRRRYHRDPRGRGAAGVRALVAGGHAAAGDTPLLAAHGQVGTEDRQSRERRAAKACAALAFDSKRNIPRSDGGEGSLFRRRATLTPSRGASIAPRTERRSHDGASRRSARANR